MKIICQNEFILFTIIFLSVQNNFPQEIPSFNKQPNLLLSNFVSYKTDKRNRSFSDDGSLFINSVAGTFSSPFNWKANDLYYAGGFLVLSAGSFLLDDEVRKVFLNNRNKTFDNLETIGYNYGAPLYTISGSLLIYTSGALFDNNWLRNTGLMLTETIVVIGIIQIPSRIIFGRARPYTESGNSSFKFLKGLGQERASFISGHAAIAFGISNILSHQINNPFATIGLYGLASLTPLSRLYADRHWFSDIFVGTALGIFISNTIINFNEKSAGRNQKFSIIPTLNGIHFIYSIN